MTRLLQAGLALATALLGLSARADTHTWTGGGANNNWNTAANWSNGAPVAGDSLVFDGNTRLITSNNFAAGTTFSNITFNSTAGAFTLNRYSFNLAGEIVNDSTNLQTFTLGFSSASTCSINTASGDITLNGVISGACMLHKKGERKLTLGGNNTYTIGTTIGGGTLSVSKDNQTTHNLGALSAGCKLTFAGGSLEVTGGALFGTGQNWLLRNVVLGPGGGTIVSPLEVGHEDYSGIGEYVSGGTVSNGLTLKGGDITLRPGAQNTLGELTVYSGRAFLRNEDTGNPYPVAASDLIVVNAGAFLVFSDHMPRSITNSMTFASGSVLCTRTHADYSGAMTQSTANAHFPSDGIMYFNYDDQVTDTITINGAWPALTGDLTIQVGGVNATVGAVTLNGPISGDHALGKAASGTLVLNATNTHNGGTTVSSGTLDVRRDGGLGSGNVAVTDAALKLGSGATHDYINDSAGLLLSGTGRVNLAYAGTDTVAALSFDGGSTFEAVGTWGSTSSSATHKDSHFTGSGILHVALPTETAVGSSANPSVYGASVTFTATVTAVGNTPTGTVQFKTNGANFGSAVSLSGGSATSDPWPATVPPGTYAVTAVYIPSGDFGASTGTLAGGQTVDPLPVCLTGSRTYDGTADAAAGILTVANKVGSDDVTVASGTGTLAGALAGSQAITSFGTLALGGAAAGDYTLAGASGAVTIAAGAVAQTRVETAADGSGSVVGSQSVRTGASITVYAITRDAGSNFAANASATWSLTDITGGVVAGDLVPQPDGKSAVFTGHVMGTARIQTQADGFTGQSGILAVPLEAGVIRLPAFEGATIGIGQPGYPAQTYFVSNTNNDQYAWWSIAASNGVGGSDAAVAHPGPNARGDDGGVIQALRVYYFPVVSNTPYAIKFLYRAVGAGFKGYSAPDASEMQMQVLESPNLEGGGFSWPNGLTIKQQATNWTFDSCTFTTLPDTVSLCLKFCMLFGDGNQTNVTDSFYLDDDRGTINELASSANPSVYGELVTFTATVSAVRSGAGTPTGTVQFKTNGANFGSAVNLSGGVAASDALPATTPPGTYTVTAEYGGDSDFTLSVGTLAGGQTVESQPTLGAGAGFTAGTNVLQWAGTSTWHYTVQYTPSICPLVDWADLPGYAGTTGWDGTMSATDTNSAAERMYYRIKLTR